MALFFDFFFFFTFEPAVKFLLRNEALLRQYKYEWPHEAKLNFGRHIFFGSFAFKYTILQNKSIKYSCWESVRWQQSSFLYVRILRFAYCWADKQSSVKCCGTQSNICGDTAVDWNNYIYIRGLYVHLAYNN